MHTLKHACTAICSRYTRLALARGRHFVRVHQLLAARAIAQYHIRSNYIRVLHKNKLRYNFSQIFTYSGTYFCIYKTQRNESNISSLK